MAPPLLVDLSKLDLDRVEIPIEEIRKVNPHRYEMEQLSGVIHLDAAAGQIVAFKEVRPDEFWVRGHIPGRPLLPGVLMIEAAAQMCSFYYKRVQEDPRFLGFGGVDGVKFRGQVVPGDRLLLLGQAVEIRNRRAVFDTQGVVGDRMVFEARITGMPI
ncbi:MAG: beta-hydroxyacyl-ACP dehydratase [Acidobacteria bacterium]|nr:beta-hydroxyacyl-ACP dehydratase [Planctomycetota bacterium]MBE3132986.1 beta-hydroxyacyl-ACP dehydratase [Acidobacteriota bacterium]